MAMLTALIPSCNDAYTLSLCLQSIAPYFEEIIVLDDASMDETPVVLERAVDSWPHIQVERHAGIPLGPVGARNRLLRLARGDHLFFLDADDVLNEYNAALLHEITELAPMVGLQLAEMWGDFDHTTQRLVHYDPCHIYLNRSILRDITWGGHGGSMQRPSFTVRASYRGETTVRGPGPLFWHLKGVKPDWRLVGRPRVRPWLAAGRRSYYYDDVLVRDPEDNHRSAMRRLLADDGDRIQRYGMTPRRPAVLDAVEPRFEIIYRDGAPADRLDRGWWAGNGSQPVVSPIFAAARRPLRAAEFALNRVDESTVELCSGGTRHRLDNLACSIWALCDGQSTIEQIAGQFASAYPGEDEKKVRDAVVETVLTLYRQKLVELVEDV